MNNKLREGILAVVLPICLVLAVATSSSARIDGITGPTFNLIAKTGTILLDDGNTIFMWGFAPSVGGVMQIPGPTLIVTEGQTVTVNLTNQLPMASSIVFPGQTGVVASGGTPGMLTNEAVASGGTVTYSFTANNPGTYIYQSGTMPELQIEMGLSGALIVRPALGTGYAYGHVDTLFDREYLFFLSEIDPDIHMNVALGQFNLLNNTDAYPVYWLMNGRGGFDSTSGSFVPFLPHQPYGGLARMHPGEKVLLRMVGAGRDPHPLHTHGNHHLVIARDGRMLESAPGMGPDNGEFAFTTTVAPGKTYDAFFTWNGEGIGWDFYGHVGPSGEIAQDCVDAGVPLEQNEPLGLHCKPIPVDLPHVQDLVQGPFYSGSPYLGGAGQLNPGEGGFNLTGGFFFMWHSHNEKELTSNDIFPGGMLTFGAIEPFNVVIEPGNP